MYVSNKYLLFLSRCGKDLYLMEVLSESKVLALVGLDFYKILKHIIFCVVVCVWCSCILLLTSFFLKKGISGKL